MNSPRSRLNVFVRLRCPVGRFIEQIVLGAKHPIPEVYQKLFHGLVIVVASLAVSTPVFGAGISIGNESAVTVPTSAHYSSLLNVRPGNGEVVSNNPPIFSWFYMTNHVAGGEQNPGGAYPNVFTQTNSFRFRLFTNSALTGTPLIDVTTAINYYNALAPLLTNVTRQFWWKWDYITNGGVYFTSATYTFSFPAQAGAVTNWDRSMLADSGYHATNSVHPVLFYRGGQETGIEAWITSATNANEYKTLTNRATFSTNAVYFKGGTNWPVNATDNPNYATVNPADAFTRVNDIGAVLNRWRFSADNRWTNAQMTAWLTSNLNAVATWHNHISNNWAWTDYGQPAGSPQLIRLIAAGYDWMYDVLGSDTGTQGGITRTNLEWALKTAVRFWSHNNFYLASPTVTGQLVLTNNYNYYLTNAQVVPWSSWQKLPNSHITIDTWIVMAVAPVLQQDATDGAFFFDWTMNYALARTSPYAGFAAYHVGPYGYVDTHVYERSLYSSLMVLDVAYPQAQLYRTDFARRFPEWFTRMLPYGMRKYHGAFGDGSPQGWTSASLGDARRGFDLAAVSRSGLARQAWDLNREFSNTLSDINSAQWDLLPLRYHYRTLPLPETNTTSALYPEDGYVVASQKSPSEFDCFTNGVGMAAHARPRGNTGGHVIASDLSLDLWAYGSFLTDGGGAGLDDYGYVAAGSPGLFVNGFGQGDGAAGLGQHTIYGQSPSMPVEARICNFTNSGTNFVYFCMDGTGMFTNALHPLSNIVTKVKRHVLFVRSKYWVIYDEFGTSSNSQFAFRWHIPWVTRHEVSSAALDNETAFSGDRYGSNSLSLTTNGFTYVGGRYDDANSSGPAIPRVNVHVWHGNDTNQLTTFVATGTGSLGSGGTSVIGTSATNSTLNPFRDRTWATAALDRAAGMWVYNRVASTNFQKLTTVVPQQPGVAAPTFLRLDDNTVAVTYDGVTETNTFGTAYSGAYTYQVATLEAGSNPGGSSGTGSAVISGAVISGGRVN